MTWETSFLKNDTQNVVEKLVPDHFLTSQNWTYLWINCLNNTSSQKNFLKVIKMVNRNFDGNHKIFRGCAREFSIDCRLCWYGVQKYSDYGVLNHALEVLERFWHGFGILVFLREKFQFSIDDCELEFVVENIWLCFP